MTHVGNEARSLFFQISWIRRREALVFLVFGVLNASHAFLPPSTRRPSFLRLSSSVEEDEIGVGIDLGTTYSAAAILVDGIPSIVSIPNNGRTMPSVVSLNKDNTFLVGKEAIENEVKNPLGSYRNVKRILGTGGTIGRQNAEVVPNVVIRDSSKKQKKSKRTKKDQPSLAKQIQEAQDNPALLYLPPIDGTRETVAPEVISAQVLKTLFDAVEQQTGKKVTRAVVGVPAYFHDAQREATIRSCNLAGISKIKLLREPEAAALAYGIGKEQIGKGDDGRAGACL